MRHRYEITFAGHVLALLLALMLVALPAGLGADKSEQGGRALVAGYVAVWNASKDAVDIEWVRQQVRAARGGKEWGKAFSAVQGRLGLRQEDFADMEPRDLQM